MRAVINYSLYTESHNRQTRPLVCVIVVFFGFGLVENTGSTLVSEQWHHSSKWDTVRGVEELNR